MRFEDRADEVPRVFGTAFAADIRRATSAQLREWPLRGHFLFRSVNPCPFFLHFLLQTGEKYVNINIIYGNTEEGW